MNKTLKIALNILIFILVAGFGYFMIHSLISDKNTIQIDAENRDYTFVSPYEKMSSFNTASDIICFDIYENTIYVALSDKISIFNLSGKHLRDVAIEENVRDIVVDSGRDAINRIPTTTTIYLLYPSRIVSYSLEGLKTDEWKSCSDNSDYCSFTATKDYLFVTDAENKHIVQYDKQGRLVRFIKSPEGFIIPSFSFDIIAINDTLYCSNSGRHKIESYTIDGEFIASFGNSGNHIGAFSGCCNPVYLEKSSGGHILTSEKGNPRISSYGRDGKFQTMLFNGTMLGGGTTAYQMRISGNDIYIANGKTISVYSIDLTCPPVNSCGECPKRKRCKG